MEMLNTSLFWLLFGYIFKKPTEYNKIDSTMKKFRCLHDSLMHAKESSTPVDVFKIVFCYDDKFI